MFLETVLILTISLLLYIFLYYKHCFTYWSKRNVETLPPKIPLGNITLDFFKGSSFLVFADVYRYFKSKKKCKYFGFYTLFRPVFVPTDTELIKKILITDFQHFTDRASYCNEEVEPLSANLFSLKGEKWKYMRTRLTPTFTSGKLKYMFHTILDCAREISTTLDKIIIQKEPVNIQELMYKFSINVIGSTAFGLDIDCFNNPNTEFKYHGLRVFNKDISRRILFFIELFFPKLLFLFRVNFVKVPRDTTEFFFKIVKDMVNYRESNNAKRNDFMQLLIELKNDKTKGEFTMDQITAQSFIFILAGFETSSTLSKFLMYELALNPEIQNRVREEIITVLKEFDGNVTYEAVSKMRYLEMCVCEAARKYPALPVLTRVCCKNYKIPDTDIVIEKGTVVLVPVQGIHYDPEYYPEPEKFDPERFSEENKKNMISCTWLPFGDGPRNCIGLRLGLLQSKIAIISLLRNHSFSLNSKTNQPLKFQVKGVVLNVDGDVYLNAQKLS
ncbi:probable cytochrome P450 6a23 [Agrilus planipennis]|uniref:Probable cytochrome P450 6a23 n=1 Tax=Agrilus planipennis TaxID=224129 RepID=A0A1W4WLV5_AGRPL|nr:probable cytochrome P450 6a23 [Agrilus planipennis]